ncbi:ribosome biogenesis GTP-binding protein YihA/YsxC [Desulfolutivibrio sp.]|uniref:ribosome biogenesis GTP-binding protein YihA/YsxC n=1 Tax=Desulfolutivibrio sp. TaxID=2773296 RepID=UPI002F96A0F8
MKPDTSPVVMTLTDTIYLPSQLKPVPAPQVALAGRSNVGKSTLVNMLGSRKGLAKISATPGKTRSLNFYHIRPGDFYLVDLPGYGYARCAKTEREKWAKLIDVYLTDNPWLRAVMAVVDCRLPPQALDLDLLAYASGQGLPTMVVLTKADKCSQREREAKKRVWADILAAPPLVFSGKTGLGRTALWAEIARLVLPGDAAARSLPAPAPEAEPGMCAAAASQDAPGPETPEADQAKATPGVKIRTKPRRRTVRAKT